MRLHPYTPSGRGTWCRRCGTTKAHRCHQPLWWRLIHPRTVRR